MEDPILWNILVERKTEYIYIYIYSPFWNLYKGSCEQWRGEGTRSRFRFNKTKGPVSSLPRHSLSKRRVSFRYRVSLRLWRTAVMKRDVKLSLQGHRTIPGCNTYKPRNFRYAPWFLPRKASWEKKRKRGEDLSYFSTTRPLSLSLYPLSIIWYDVWHILGQSCNEIFSFSDTCSLPPHVLC